MSSSEDELVEEPDESITNDTVVVKYKTAGMICNSTLRKVLAECKPGASARDLCTLGDDIIFKETDKIYRKEKDLKKGMAFPTCVSINFVAANFSPLKTDDDELLKEGDLVKIELGVHIDGYIATAAHSVVAGTWKDIASAGGSGTTTGAASNNDSSSVPKEAAAGDALSNNNNNAEPPPPPAGDDNKNKTTANGDAVKSTTNAAAVTTEKKPTDSKSASSSSQQHCIKGRVADCIKAAYTALDVAMRLMKPDTKDLQITKAIQQVADDFKCKPVQNTLSMRMARNQPESEQRILNNPSDEVKREHKEHTITVNTVYQLNILMSTGDGKCKESAKRRCTVHRRPDEGTYNLKLRASRQVLSEAEKRFGSMAFSLRSLEDERQARLGVVECVNHKVWTRYPVLEEKEGELVAQFKVTIFVTPNGVQIIAGLPISTGGIMLQPKYALQNAEVKQILSAKAGSGGSGGAGAGGGGGVGGVSGAVTAKKANRKKKTTAKKAAAEAVAAAVGDLNVDDDDEDDENEAKNEKAKNEKKVAADVKLNNDSVAASNKQ